jgi:hypothetical protein
MLRIRIQSGRYNFAGYTVQNIGNYDIYDDDEKEKKLDTSDFPTCAKLMGRIGIRIWIGIKMESGIRIGL